ncbi:MAG: PilZ domain-containing protein [Candidatus Omnitrophota bacterium]|nr:PilZ domain-containing protein [Candidatus Omnitrophota bacterium]
MEDRRIFARIDAKLEMRFLDSFSGRQGKAQTTNISADGFGLVTTEKLPKNISLEVWLDIPDQHEPFYSRAEVVWLRPSSHAGNYRAGLRLEKAELMGMARVLWLKKKTKEKDNAKAAS